MRKRKNTILPQFSLVAGVALFLIVTWAILDFRDRSKTNFILQEQERFWSLKKNVKAIQLELTLARLDESQLTSSRKLIFFESFEERIKYILELSENLKEQCQNDREILILLSNTTRILDRYRISVNNILKAQTHMGLVGQEGVLLETTEAKREIENYLEKTNQDSLIVEFIHMQLDEKEFSNSLDMRIADGLLKRAKQLSQDVETLNLSPQLKIGLENELNHYRVLVSQLTANILELELLIAESTLQYQLIAPELIKIDQEIDTLLNQAAEDLREQRHQSLYQMLIIFTSALLVLSLFTFLKIRSSQQLVIRLRNLAQGMEEIAVGNFLNTHSLPQGDDEIGFLTQRFLNMSLQIKTQIKTIKQEQKKAEDANQSKSKFLASMSHELRTPLNAILGFTQLMNRDLSLNQDHQKKLNIILQSGEHLLALINDVLDLSKIESGRITLTIKSFDLYKLIETLEVMLKVKANTKKIDFLIECDSEIPRWIKTDEVKLRQILINLLGNAIKFTEKGQVILRVSWLKYPAIPIGKISFEVEDTGPGIAPEEMSRLFEAFVQTETGRKSGEGTGLGLPISQKFVELMGGELRVESVIEKGSIFSFDIQVECLDLGKLETEVQRKRVIALQPNQAKYRIAIVEDKLENRLVLNELLVSVGFEVAEAYNGQEAIALWEQWNPHLIWMDIQMPEMDGYEATRCIRHLEKQKLTLLPQPPPPVTIIALTASVLEHERAAIFEAGCDEFVSKPFQETEIFEKIEKYLGVRYIYEEPKDLDRVTTEPSQDLSDVSQQLKTLSIDWIYSLHQSCMEADGDKALELIDEIRDACPRVVDSLTYLIENFQFEQLTHMTEVILNQQEF
ncbi:ATP-binding protein [Roseofilum sp. Guam]|uniref:ATP-binding protein n=1 Tax=Roseofilum sp. Guam TaxID=2821502 RepID=UPI001B0E1B6B|nr:ATP-binding protein [Roseofilum sp. Guam]MBP0027209.1 response regulator [Roseofilum sp. Guam]